MRLNIENSRVLKNLYELSTTFNFKGSYSLRKWKIKQINAILQWIYAITDKYNIDNNTKAWVRRNVDRKQLFCEKVVDVISVHAIVYLFSLNYS